jgi:hypothetical protein
MSNPLVKDDTLVLVTPVIGDIFLVIEKGKQFA